MHGLPPNLHQLASTRLPLGVWCCDCRRAVLLSAEQVGAKSGEMGYIRDLRLVCQGCGSRRFKFRLFTKLAEVTAWVESPTEPAD